MSAVSATWGGREWHTLRVRASRPGAERTLGSRTLAGVAGLLIGAAALTGCTSSSPAPQGQEPAAPQATLTVSPDDTTPAQRALAHVPGAVTAVTVTDFDRAALQLGLEELSSDLPQRERNDFWDRARRQTAILSDGLLRPVGPQLLRDHSFAQEDVGWEARLFDDQGQEVGWILGLHTIIDPRAVQKAVDAGVGPLADAVVDVDAGLVLSGAAVDATDPWGDDDPTGMLVTGNAVGTYVERGCVPAPAGASGLEPLAAYSVALEGTLATVRLGTDRQDLFARIALAAEDEQVTKAFEGGVADPGSGRIGYRLTDPVAAAELTLRRALPFAACAD